MKSSTKKNPLLIIIILSILLIGFVGFIALSPSIRQFTMASGKDQLVLLLLCKEKPEDNTISDAILYRLNTSSYTYEPTPYPSDTILEKGGAYNNNLYGGYITLQALYQAADSWGGKTATEAVLKQAFSDNWGITVHEVIEVSPEHYSIVKIDR